MEPSLNRGSNRRRSPSVRRNQKAELPEPNRTPTAMGTGLLALDVVFSSDQFEAIGRWAGGTFGNVMAILSYLGWKSVPVARLEKNHEADEILRDLKRWKVHLSFIRHDELASTPIIIEYIRRTSEGDAVHRFSLRCPVCGKRLPAFRPMAARQAKELLPDLPQPHVFFFDRVSRSALELAQWSAQGGAVVVFEPSSVGEPRQFNEALEIAHILKYSHERFGENAAIADAQRPLLVIETLGECGLRFRSRLRDAPKSSWTRCKPFRVRRIRDTAGAGDWCVAGLIDQLARDGRESLENTTQAQLTSALAYGQALAAWNCHFEGARGGMYRLAREQFEKQISHILSGGDPFERESFAALHPTTDSGTSQHFCSSCR